MRPSKQKGFQVSCATILFVILAQHDDKIHVPRKNLSQILTLCHIYFLQYIRVESYIWEKLWSHCLVNRLIDYKFAISFSSNTRVFFLSLGKCPCVAMETHNTIVIYVWARDILLPKIDTAIVVENNVHVTITTV